MRFDLITVLPSLLESPFAHSILQRAQKKGIAEIHVHNLRDYSARRWLSRDNDFAAQDAREEQGLQIPHAPETSFA